jgi:hypothetical protein
MTQADYRVQPVVRHRTKDGLIKPVAAYGSAEPIGWKIIELHDGNLYYVREDRHDSHQEAHP